MDLQDEQSSSGTGEEGGGTPILQTGKITEVKGLAQNHKESSRHTLVLITKD